MSRRQLPRATAAQLDAATFLPGEIAVDTTNDELRYDGDGIHGAAPYRARRLRCPA